jgi:hypothetical protein
VVEQSTLIPQIEGLTPASGSGRKKVMKNSSNFSFHQYFKVKFGNCNNNALNVVNFSHRMRVGKIFELVILVLFLKTYLGGGQAPFSPIVGSLLIPLANEVVWENDLSIPPIDSTNSKI